MKKIYLGCAFLFLCSSTALLTGCSFSQNTTLDKFQSINKWQILAKDISRNIIGSKITEKTYNSNNCLFIEPLPGEFGSTFTEMLKTELVNMQKQQENTASWPISSQKDNCHTLKIKVNVIHQPGRVQPRFYPGTFTVLGAGIIALRDYLVVEDRVLLATGILSDIFIEPKRYDINKASSELFISISIEKNGFYLFRHNSLYLIRNADRHLFNNPEQGKSKTFSIKGP